MFRFLFYIGNKYYRFSIDTLDPSYPQPLTTLGLPKWLKRIDAVLVWGNNNRTFFFSGNQYWRYDDETQSTEPDYPRDMRLWRGIGYHINAAFQHYDGIYLVWLGVCVSNVVSLLKYLPLNSWTRQNVLLQKQRLLGVRRLHHVGGARPSENVCISLDELSTRWASGWGGGWGGIQQIQNDTKRTANIKVGLPFERTKTEDDCWWLAADWRRGDCNADRPLKCIYTIYSDKKPISKEKI